MLTSTAIQQKLKCRVLKMAFPSTIRYSTISRILISAILACLLVITVSLLLTMEIFSMYQGLPFEPHLMESKHSNFKSSLESGIMINSCPDNSNNKNVSASLSKYSKYLRKENARLVGRVQVCQELNNKRRQQKLSMSRTDVLTDEAHQVMTVSRDLFDYLAVHLRNTSYPGVDNYIKYKVAQMGLTPLVNVKPLIPEFGNVINDVLSFKYPISVPPCREKAQINPSATSVFFAINSAPANFRKRQVIRQTWRNHLKDAHRERLLTVAGFAFTLGLTDDAETQQKIEEESDTYGDIIQIGISDFYLNMSMKVAGLFNWLYKYCNAKIDFVVKLDDDVYVNVRNLVHFVQFHHQHHPSGNVLSMFGVSSPTSDDFLAHRDGKWNISFDEWPWKHYPHYYLGPAVLIQGNTILGLLAAIQTTPMMPFDDVYYSGICTEKAGIKIYHSYSSNRVLTLDMPVVPPACELRRFIAWMTDSEIHMTNSQVAIDKFYRNASQCVSINSNGIGTSFDYSHPVRFYFK